MGVPATGSFQVCGTGTLAGTGTLVGQGKKPILWALLSTSDASYYSPVFTDVSDDVRSYSVSRGRESELQDFDAGTCQVTFDNRQNEYDPNYLSTIRPQNQIRLFEQFNGITNPLFTGCADAWDLQWPGTGSSDAVSVGTFTDEFKNLNLDRLPTMDPPRDTYNDVVLYDQPADYWPMNDLAATGQAQAATGPTLARVLGTLSNVTTPIIGSTDTALRLSSATLQANFASGDPEDPNGLAEITVEMWVYSTASAIPNFLGPLNAGTQYLFSMQSFSGPVWQVRNSGGTNHSVTYTGLQNNLWYHLVGTITGGNLRLYINGSEVGSTAFSGVVGASAATANFTSAGSGDIAHVAVYRYGLSAARVLAHYQAGRQRGFVTENTAERSRNILDSVTNHAPRNIRQGARSVIATYKKGQPPLEELKRARNAEAVDAMLFIGADGTVNLLDSAHRSSSPWKDIQYTFGDEGTAGQLPYEDLDVDYSESFLFNEWNVTRTDGLVQTRSDTTSITKYYKRSQSLTDVPVPADSDADNIAVAELAKYKDPLFRALTLTLTTADLNVLDAMFQLEIGDKIRIIRTLPGPGGWFDQEVWIQKIQVDADNMQGPWRMTLGVSPV